MIRAPSNAPPLPCLTFRVSAAKERTRGCDIGSAFALSLMVRCPGGITMIENTWVKAASLDVVAVRDPLVLRKDGRQIALTAD